MAACAVRGATGLAVGTHAMASEEGAGGAGGAGPDPDAEQAESGGFGSEHQPQHQPQHQRGEDSDQEASQEASQDTSRDAGPGAGEEASQDAVPSPDADASQDASEVDSQDAGQDAGAEADQDTDQLAHQDADQDAHQEADQEADQVASGNGSVDGSPEASQDSHRGTSRGGGDGDSQSSASGRYNEKDIEDEDEDAAEEAESSDSDESYPSKTLRSGRSRAAGAVRPKAGRPGLRRGRGRSRDEEAREEAGSDEESEDEVDLGLRFGLKILQDLLSTNSTFLHYPESKKGMVDYHDVIEKPMWFEEIQRRFYNNEYTSIVDFVKDVRLLLLNEYRYFGPNEIRTKRALRIEQVLEYKLAGLPKELKTQCSLMATHGIVTNDGDEDGPVLRKTGDFFSHLLASVSEERMEREKKKKNVLNEIRRLDQEGRGKDILKWETEILLAPPFITQMRTLWELPLIGHLVQLTVQVLCIEQVPQYEVERMFLMPRASKTLAVLMTSLLSPPIQRPKLQHLPPMPYFVWSRKLSQRVAVWYRMFQTRNQDWSKLFELCGIEKDFWSILGDWNQLEDYEFHELSFHQRVWLVKTLCDYQVHNHKTMQDALAEHSQQQQNCQLLGEDRHGRQYIYFPQFCSAPGLCTCVRVYRCVIPTETHSFPDPSEEVPYVHVRTGRGDFLPIWLRGRGRSKGKSSKGKVTKKNLAKEINNRKFLSRLVYRMPNGMHIRGKKKRGKASDGASQPLQQEQKLDQIPSPLPKVNVDGHPSDSEDKSAAPDVEERGRRITRQTRLRRNTSQGFYGEWSDSDSVSTPSPGSSMSKKSLQSKQKSTSMSTNDENSSSNSLKLKLKTSEMPNKGTASKQSDELENSEDELITKSPDANEDDSSNDSGCGEEGSRRAWAVSASSEKLVDGGDDSEEADEDEKDDRISVKKEEGFFNISDDLPWMPDDSNLHGKNKQKRPHFNPERMLLGAEHFELVADSVQGVRDLIDSLCEEDDNVGLLQRLRKSASSTKPPCEEKLANKLEELVNEIESLEVKMESNAQKLRWKLFDEWDEFQKKSHEVKDEAENYWLTVFKSGMDDTASEVKTEIKHEKSDSLITCESPQTVKCEKQDQSLDTVDDESQTGYDIRHSLRAKKPKVDTPQPTWLSSEDESSDEMQDDVWEMPGRRRKKKTNPGRSRRKDAKSEDEADKTCAKKTLEKPLGVAKNFSFEPCSSVKEASQEEGEKNPISMDSGQQKSNQKMLPNKLTLDKEGNMFITLGCGTKVHLRKDEEGRIMVPEGNEGLSMIQGKTLEQLVGSGKVVQNKKRKPKKAPQTIKHNPSGDQFFPTKRSTTLFPAVGPGDIVQAKEWMPPVVKKNIQVKSLAKVQGVQVQAKEWTPPLEKKISSSVTMVPTGSGGTQPPVRTYAKQKNARAKPVNANIVSLQTQAKKKIEPADVVVLSDGSDDSIEVIKETEPSSKAKTGPRIQSVVGNANVNSFASKPLTKSVTMTPVLKTKAETPKKNAWSPVITNTVSLEPVPSSSRVPAPGAPQVVITPAKNAPARRNLQQGGAHNQPNTNIVTVSTVPMRQPQQQFVPMNQMVSINNSFQPVAQVVSMNSMNNHQFLVANSSYPQMGSPYLVNAGPTYHYVPVTATPAQVPLPLPVSAFDVGLPPGLTGQIVLANGDNNQFSYAFKLDDGGLIFLTNEQVSKIRAANGGKLTTMVQFQTH